MVRSVSLSSGRPRKKENPHSRRRRCHPRDLRRPESLPPRTLRSSSTRTLLPHPASPPTNPADRRADARNFIAVKGKSRLARTRKHQSKGRQHSNRKRLEVLNDMDDVPDKVKIFASCVFKDAASREIFLGSNSRLWSLYLHENWDGILKVVPVSGLLWSIVNNIVPLFTSNHKAEEISNFLTNYTVPALERALKVIKLKMV